MVAVDAFQILCLLYLPLIRAQIHRSEAAPHYTLTHYVLMVTSFVLILFLVLGILLLVKKHSALWWLVRKSRRQVVWVPPPPPRPTAEELATVDELVIEDLVDGQLDVEFS